MQAGPRDLQGEQAVGRKWLLMNGLEELILSGALKEGQE